MDTIAKNQTIAVDGQIKAFLQYPSGSGVYLVKRTITDKIIHYVVVVHGAGYLTDYVINYENGSYGYDNINPSKTTHNAVRKAFKYMYKNMLHLTQTVKG